MILVLDTNVLVSGFLSPFGPPAVLLRMALDGSVRAAFDSRILAEYAAVLARPRFRFDPGAVEIVLAALEAEGDLVLPRPLPARLLDPADEPFLEAALAAQAWLVTGNGRHFPPRLRFGATVLSPREAVGRLRGLER